MKIARPISATLVSIAISAVCAFSVGCGDEGGEPVILDVTPREGAVIGDQPVQIKGANFRPDIGYRVYFGNKKATQVTVIDPETLLAVTPENTEEGPVSITILADNGPAYQVTGGFSYVNANAAAAAGAEERGNLAY